jgi:hypothetical protein
MRSTLETDKPLVFAMPRELQCVAFLGTLAKVVTITASTRASSIVRGAPERASSRRPSTRCWAKRRRHLPTVALPRLSLTATPPLLPIYPWHNDANLLRI